MGLPHYEKSGTAFDEAKINQIGAELVDQHGERIDLGHRKIVIASTDQGRATDQRGERATDGSLRAGTGLHDGRGPVKGLPLRRLGAVVLAVAGWIDHQCGLRLDEKRKAESGKQK